MEWNYSEASRESCDSSRCVIWRIVDLRYHIFTTGLASRALVAGGAKRCYSGVLHLPSLVPGVTSYLAKGHGEELAFLRNCRSFHHEDTCFSLLRWDGLTHYNAVITLIPGPRDKVPVPFDSSSFSSSNSTFEVYKPQRNQDIRLSPRGHQGPGVI